MFEMQESVTETDDVRWNAIMDNIIKWNGTGRAAHIYSGCTSAEVASEIRDLWEFANGAWSVT
jgi:hypothetical protein